MTCEKTGWFRLLSLKLARKSTGRKKQHHIRFIETTAYCLVRKAILLTITNFDNDLAEMEKKLKQYTQNGISFDSSGLLGEHIISITPDASQIKPLRRTDSFCGTFVAVDCSTRTLKRVNNWGIYLMRTAHVFVKEREVEWNYEERLFTAVGDTKTRSNSLKDYRMELESELALKLLKSENVDCDNSENATNYLLLDGGGYFGGRRKFRLSLYNKCEEMGIVLSALSKNSPLLHDEKGRDLIASASVLSPYDLWTYHPVRVADRGRSLFGDICLVKLCDASPRVFRCDIMEYLKGQKVSEILSPLTAVANDARCLGYPVPVYLAHEFSGPSDTALLHYYDTIEDRLKEVGLSKILHLEEQSCSFADELHGVQYAFRREVIGDYV